MLSAVKYEDKTSAWSEPYPFRKKLELSNQRRRFIRFIRALWQYSSNSYRKRTKNERDCLRCLWRRYGCECLREASSWPLHSLLLPNLRPKMLLIILTVSIYKSVILSSYITCQQNRTLRQLRLILPDEKKSWPNWRKGMILEIHNIPDVVSASSWLSVMHLTRRYSVSLHTLVVSWKPFRKAKEWNISSSLSISSIINDSMHYFSYVSASALADDAFLRVQRSPTHPGQAWSICGEYCCGYCRLVCKVRLSKICRCE